MERPWRKEPAGTVIESKGIMGIKVTAVVIENFKCKRRDHKDLLLLNSYGNKRCSDLQTVWGYEYYFENYIVVKGTKLKLVSRKSK